jgi:hypothetical protein
MRSLLVSLAALGGLALTLIFVLGVGLAHVSRMSSSPGSPAPIDGTSAPGETGNSPDPPAVSTTPPASVPLPPQPGSPAATTEPGVILLRPQDAHLVAPGLRLTTQAAGDGAIYWQDDLRARASWDFDSPGGNYDLELTYSSAGPERSFLATLGGEEFRCRTSSTGLWSRARAETVGRAALPAGRSQLLLRQIDKGGAPINLLKVRLVPSPPLPVFGLVPAGAPDLPAGSIVLAAADARINGQTLQLEKESLTNWSQLADYPEWDLNVPQAGLYVICLVRASAPDTGGPFELEVAGSLLRSRSFSTGSFRSLRRMEVGAVALPAGATHLTLKPDGPIAASLMTLRRVELVPATAAALAFAPPPVGGPGNAARVYKVDDEGFIRNFLVLAPIKLDAKVANHDEASCRPYLDREYCPGQKTATPREGDPATIDGVPLAWTALAAEDFSTDLTQVAADAGKDAGHTAALGVIYVTSPREMSNVKLSIGSDDDSAWRLNGKEIIRFYGGRAIAKDQNKSDPQTLRQGINTLMFVVLNGDGPTAAAARFIDKDGNAVRELTVSLTPPGR